MCCFAACRLVCGAWGEPTSGCPLCGPIGVNSQLTTSFLQTCYICEEQGRESKAASGACMTCNRHGCRQAFHVTWWVPYSISSMTPPATVFTSTTSVLSLAGDKGPLQEELGKLHWLYLMWVEYFCHPLDMEGIPLGWQALADRGLPRAGVVSSGAVSRTGWNPRTNQLAHSLGMYLHKHSTSKSIMWMMLFLKSGTLRTLKAKKQCYLSQEGWDYQLCIGDSMGFLLRRCVPME